MASPHYILDAGPLVAYANTRDQHHDWACHVLAALGEPPLTCEIVLAEACYRCAESPRAIEMILALPSRGHVLVAPVLTTDSDAVRATVLKYWPRMDVADGCMVRLSELHPQAKVITTDVADFSIYRRARNQPIPLIHP